VVQLNPNSTISYPEHFGQKTRTVYLKGEAFFNIKRNPAKPFVVHTGDLVTEVLGTSFTIKSYENSNLLRYWFEREKYRFMNENEENKNAMGSFNT
jgi:ferric-dicitrate binding protein FerR (iron transport regulator)